MEIIRKNLFESETLQIGLFEVRPVSDACGDVERQDRNIVVLPFSGVFSKHDAPGRHVIGTPSHAVFVAADTPYRIGSAIVRSRCGLARIWRLKRSIHAAMARPWHRTGCCPPRP